MGFKTEQFVGNVDENFKCSICLEVLKDPWQCGDGHTFCYDCITLCLEDRQICPMGNNPLQLNSLVRNLVVRNVVENFQVYCHPPKSDGEDGEESEPKCDWIGNLQSLAKHRQTCSFQQVQCPNVGCNTDIQRRELEDHDKICEYKEVRCDEKCGKILPKCDLPDHKRNDCPEVKLPCPNNCWTRCPTIVKRGNITTHKQTCVFQRVLCPNMGCNSDMQRRQLEDHDKICVYKEVECQNCGEVLVRLELPVHENEDCPEEMLARQNRRRADTGQISEIKRDDCVDCPFKDQGCPVQVERQHVDKHVQEHMMLLEKQCSSLSKQNSSLLKENKQLKQELNQVKEGLNREKVDSYPTLPSQQMPYRGPGQQVSAPFNQMQYTGYSPSASIPPPMYPGQSLVFVRNPAMPQSMPGPQYQQTRPEQQPAPAPRKRNIIQIIDPKQDNKDITDEILSQSSTNATNSGSPSLSGHSNTPPQENVSKNNESRVAELKRFSEAFPWSLPPPMYPGQPDMFVRNDPVPQNMPEAFPCSLPRQLMFVRNAPMPENKHASTQFQQTRPEQQPAPAPRKRNIQIKDPEQDNKDITDEILSQSSTNATNSGSPSLSGHSNTPPQENVSKHNYQAH